MFRKIARGFWMYIKDWKNLLTHGLIGVAILCVALFLPIRPVYRISILVLVIAANLVRMRLEKRKKGAETATEEQS